MFIIIIIIKILLFFAKTENMTQIAKHLQMPLDLLQTDTQLNRILIATLMMKTSC